MRTNNKNSARGNIEHTKTKLFENVVLEKSSLAQEGSTIKKFIVKLIIKDELINSQLVEMSEETEE